MNNDINFVKNGKKFNYRIAIIIRNEDKILIQENKLKDYYSIPGGRCEMGEDSITTGLREFKEETGYDVTYKKSIGMVENFFISSFNNENYHEILLIHEYTLDDKSIYKKEVINSIEDDNVFYIWESIEKLKKNNLKPAIILEMLNSNEFIHKIYREN